ncbi:MAG: hypothetical protein LUD79_07310 [Oscillospiraceae bacterium]|nr:hypothetical protein [Oscillospiraceae bacterium]
MKLRSLKDVEAFKQAIGKCSNSVWLESVHGDKYDLKSAMSQYIGIAALLQDQNEELELFANGTQDQYILMEFLDGLSA